MITDIFIKELEKSFQQYANKDNFLFARLDGRSFHNFTKKLIQPFDKNLYNLFYVTAEYLLKEYNPNLIYFQSDEISLIWKLQNEYSEFPFGGKYQKLNSHLAASTSAFFNKNLEKYIPEKSHLIPTFDCRIFECYRPEIALEVFKWRQKDAIKNSISMAATSYGSHKEVLGMNSDERIKYLKSKGIDYYSLPEQFRFGTFLKKKVKTLINDKNEEYQRSEIYSPLLSIMDYDTNEFMKLMEKL